MAEKIGKSDEFKKEMVAFYLQPNPTKATARQFGMSYGGARKILVKAGVLRDEPWGFVKPEIIQDILKRWSAGESQAVIGKAISMSQTKVGRLLWQNGVQVESRRAGPNSGVWKGGRWKHGRYWRVFVSQDDPFRAMADRNGYVLEHRLVMAKSLERFLTPSETVHHIDGDSMNNEIKNLQLRQGRHGKGMHMCCLDCGSQRVGFSPLATAD